MSSLTRIRPFAFTGRELPDLAQAFRQAGFDEAGLSAALGLKSMAAIKDFPAQEAIRRTASGSPLDSLIRLFMIGFPVSAEAAKAALQAEPERLRAAGLLRKHEEGYLSAVSFTPVDGLLLAFDRLFPGEKMEGSDFVMGPSDSAHTLSRWLLRRKFARALDVGAGNGHLALLLAREGGRVVATDVNPRAAAFVEFNAALNGIAGVEPRTGDLFAPVAGERFDLVFSNPPFVISPENAIVYKHGGMKSDGFCRRLAAEAPAYLEEGGFFQMIFNWVEEAEGDWQARLQGWWEGSGCDAWVLRSWSSDPETYARAWAGEDRQDAWLEYYRAENIAAIGSGVAIARRRAGGANWFRGFDAPPGMLGPCGVHAEARMAALDFLARPAAADAALLKARLKLSPLARLTQECSPGEGGWELATAHVRMAEGFAYVEEVDVYLANLLAACDGRRSLAAAIAAAAAATGLSDEEVPEQTPAIVRQLIEEGFLIPESKPKEKK